MTDRSNREHREDLCKLLNSLQSDDQQKRNVRLILLHLDGHSFKDLARLSTQKLSARRIRQIVNAYQKDGISSIKPNARCVPPVRESLMSPDQESLFTARIEEPPPDGGKWTGPKAADLIAELSGKSNVGRQRGWEYLRKHRK
jgi:hypothetical protein